MEDEGEASRQHDALRHGAKDGKRNLHGGESTAKGGRVNRMKAQKNPGACAAGAFLRGGKLLFLQPDVDHRGVLLIRAGRVERNVG